MILLLKYSYRYLKYLECKHSIYIQFSINIMFYEVMKKQNKKIKMYKYFKIFEFL